MTSDPPVKGYTWQYSLSSGLLTPKITSYTWLCNWNFTSLELINSAPNCQDPSARDKKSAWEKSFKWHRINAFSTVIALIHMLILHFCSSLGSLQLLKESLCALSFFSRTNVSFSTSSVLCQEHAIKIEVISPQQYVLW